MNAAPSSGPCAIPDRPIAIIGAGITGLTAAWHLRRAGASVLVFEASNRAGGAIESIRRDGWLHDTGPNSILEGAPEVEALLAELNLTDRRVFAAPSARNRYVLRHDQLQALPTSPAGFGRTRLFSSRAKLRLVTEFFRPRGSRTEGETVAEFARRRLGKEFLDYAIDPFVAGVYAGDPDRLSLRHAFPKLLKLEKEHRSLLLGAIRRRNSNGGPAGRMFAFADGLEELPRALASSLGDRLRLNCRISRVARTGNLWDIESSRRNEIQSELFSRVVCALPPDALAALARADCPALAGLSELSEIEQPPVASIFLGYQRSDVQHPLDGFGLLNPRSENRRALGILFSSTLFPRRAPAGCVGITCFVGGARQPALGRLPEAALIELAHAEAVSLLGARQRPAWASVRRHPRAIPQYTVGYDRFLARCTEAEQAAPGLLIGGKTRDGISLPACIAAGKRLAWAALGRNAPPSLSS